MKKLITILMTGILAIGLVACSGQAAPTQTSTQAADTGALSASELAAGTIKLQETDSAVSGDQAGELLTLWLAYKEVANSDTASDQELAALVTQISDTMTSEQLSSIESMNLTNTDMEALTGISSTAATDTSSTSAASNSGGMGGGPGDGMPSDGGMSGDMSLSGDMPTGDTASPSMGTGSDTTSLTLELVDPLTTLLEQTSAA